ncbi:three-Cys-motif partner protein TcmP [Ruegeria marisrubri]|uniref:three-Cys-motif partner protein TcmP n=1 Tax=Ruegeria marisrubri TaxID=1685379 RepID=UPI0039909DE4
MERLPNACCSSEDFRNFDMKKDHSENVVGPWAEEKLELLEKYLKAYNIALKNQRFRRVYIDGFAGSPVCKIRTKTPPDSGPSAFLDDEEAAQAQERFITGSPIRPISVIKIGSD